jgi:hypothetical protein
MAIGAAPTLQVTVAELEAVRGEVARLTHASPASKSASGRGAEHAAEFRGEMRAAVGRIFDKLNIQPGSVP